MLYNHFKSTICFIVDSLPVTSDTDSEQILMGKLRLQFPISGHCKGSGGETQSTKYWETLYSRKFPSSIQENYDIFASM